MHRLKGRRFRFGLLLIVLLAAAGLAFSDDDDETNDDGQYVEQVIVIGRVDDQAEPEVPFNSVASRDLFGPEQVRETPARNLNDMVQHVPAISTRPYNGGEAAAPSFSMRGLPDDGLTEFIHVLIDGIPANPLPYGWTAFSFMPVTPDRIHAIDYVRGGHTVRYSPDTVGGVLNIITKPLPTRPALSAHLTGGDLGFATGMVSGGTQAGKVSILGTYVGRRGDGYRDDGEWDQRDATVKLRWNLGEKRWLAATASYMDSSHKAPGGLTLDQYDLNRFGNSRPENGFTGYRSVLDLLYRQETNKDAWFELFVTGATTNRNLRAQRPKFGTPDTISDWRDDSHYWSVGARAEKILQAGKTRHALYGGVRVHREWIPDWTIDSEPYPGGAGTRTLDSTFRINAVSAHFDDTIDITDRLNVVAGLRLEWVPEAKGSDPFVPFSYEGSYFALLPGVGVSYVISDSVAIYANRFEGFRAPQVFGFAYVRPGESLDFESSTISEGGLRYRTGGGVSGTATLWRTAYDDFYVFAGDGYYENLGDIEAEGVDLGLTWEIDKVWIAAKGFALSASITGQDSRIRSGVYSGNLVPHAWRVKGAWRLRYSPRSWSFVLGGTYVGESYSDAANTREESPDGQIGLNPARALWDLRVAKEFRLARRGSIGVSVGVTNLVDREWYVHSRGGFFGGGKVAGAPRQTHLSVRYSFE